jgi:cytoskeletal protein CcmA (bactofilin family)
MPHDKNQTKQQTDETSRLGKSFVLKGAISGDGDMVIEGLVAGGIDLGLHDLIVEKGGRVEADVRARNVTIHGEVTGNVQAAEKIFISETGWMKGDIAATVISILAGARFRGSIKMERRSPIP